MNPDSLERKLLQLQQNAIVALGEMIGGDALKITEQLKKDVEAHINAEGQLALEGRWGKNTVNHRKVHPERQRVTLTDVIDLIEEFIHTDTTNREVGGLWSLTQLHGDTLPEKMKDAVSGFYELDYHLNLVLRFPQGKDTHFFVMKLPRIPEESVIVGVLSCLQLYPDRVLTHEFFDVLNKSTLRTVFINTLKKAGFELPMFISEKTMVEAIKETRQEGVQFDYHHLSLCYEDGKLRVWDASRPWAWEKLNCTKQNQFYKRING